MGSCKLKNGKKDGKDKILIDAMFECAGEGEGMRAREGSGIIPKSLTSAEWRMMVLPCKVKFELGSLQASR